MQDALSTTAEFIERIQTRALLLQTGTVRIYKQVVFKEIEHVKQQIRQLIKGSTNQVDELNAENLSLVMKALDDFQQSFELSQVEMCDEIDVTIEITPHLHEENSESQTDFLVQEDLQLKEEKPEDIPIDPSPSLGDELQHVLSEAETKLSEAAHVVIQTIQNEFYPPDMQDSSPAMHTAVPQACIDELQHFIAEEERAIEKENKFSFFHSKPILADQIGWGHHHSRNDKIKAARQLIEALEQRNKGETVAAHNWSDEIYTNNKHLKMVIQKYHLDAALACSPP